MKLKKLKDKYPDKIIGKNLLTGSSAILHIVMNLMKEMYMIELEEILVVLK